MYIIIGAILLAGLIFIIMLRMYLMNDKRLARKYGGRYGEKLKRAFLFETDVIYSAVEMNDKMGKLIKQQQEQAKQNNELLQELIKLQKENAELKKSSDSK